MSSRKNYATIDLTYENQYLKSEFFECFEKIYDANQLQAGPSLEQFRRSLASYCGTKCAALTGSGTMALHMAAKAMEIKPGDEIIVPANTFFATATGLAHAGAKIILADVDPESFLLTAEAVEKVITPKTKAIAPVHLYGAIVDPKPLEKFGLPLIEDASHAFGGELRGKKVGNLMTIAAFSAGPIKGFGAIGHSGFLTYNQENWDSYLQAFAANGQAQRHIATYFGHNFMMDCVNALFLDLKLKAWPEMLSRRRAAVKIYDELFKGSNLLKTQKQTVGSNPSLWVYVVRVDPKIRDQVIADLKEDGIQTLIQYTVTVNQVPAWKEIMAKTTEIPVSEGLVKGIISLPVHAGIEPEDALFIGNKVLASLERRSTH